MSFDLYAWNDPVPRSPEEARDLLSSFMNEGSPAVFAPSSTLQRFRAALLREYPPLEYLPDAEVQASPWAMTPTDSDRLVEIHIGWQTGDEVLLRIVELALGFGVVLYDPQGPDLHSPAGVTKKGRSRTETAASTETSSERRSPLVIVGIALAVLLPFALWLLMAVASRPVGP